MGLLPYPRRSLTQFAHLPASPPPFAAHSCRPLSPHSPPRPHPQPGISPSPCGLLYGSPRRLYLSLCTRSYDEQYTVLRVAHCTTCRSSTGVLKRGAYIIQQRSTDLHFAHTHSTHRRLCYGLATCSYQLRRRKIRTRSMVQGAHSRAQRPLLSCYPPIYHTRCKDTTKGCESWRYGR